MRFIDIILRGLTTTCRGRKSHQKSQTAWLVRCYFAGGRRKTVGGVSKKTSGPRRSDCAFGPQKVSRSLPAHSVTAIHLRLLLLRLLICWLWVSSTSVFSDGAPPSVTTHFQVLEHIPLASNPVVKLQ